MEINVAEQRLYLLPAKVTPEQAKERALEQKLHVFGTIAKFLMRPKGEEIQVVLQELRYQPFWHAASHKRFRYNRRAQYQVPVSADVQVVEIAGQMYTPVQGKLTLQGVDHCLVDDRREIFLDGLTGEVRDLRQYLEFDRKAVDEDGALLQDLALVPAEVRASAVVRQVLGDVLHPPFGWTISTCTIARSMPSSTFGRRKVSERRWRSTGSLANSSPRARRLVTS